LQGHFVKKGIDIFFLNIHLSIQRYTIIAERTRMLQLMHGQVPPTVGPKQPITWRDSQDRQTVYII